MARRSRMVNRRNLAAKTLRGGVTANGQRPAKILEQRMAVVLEEGEQVPDVGHFIDVLSRMLVHEVEELEEADHTRWANTAAEQTVRRFYRDPAVDELRQMIVDLRKCLIGMYGTKKANDILHLSGRTPRAIEDLKMLGRTLVDVLPTIDLPAPKVELGVSPRIWANKMEPLVERLEKHFKDLHRRSENQYVAVDARNAQLGGFDGVYGPVTKLIECVFLLGGEPRKASFLRLRFRRRLVNRRAAMAAGSANSATKPWTPVKKVARSWRGFPARVIGRIAPWMSIPWPGE